MDLEFYLDTPPWDWPPDSGKLFLSVLRDKKTKPTDRLIAAELAGNATVVDDALADALLTVVVDPIEPEELRAKAAISLGPVLEMADTADLDEEYKLERIPITMPIFEDIKLALRKTYLDDRTPKIVRRRILEASVRANQPWHRSAISTAYATGDTEWVLTAVFAMNYVSGFDKEILESLKSTDEDTRCEAITAAGDWEITAAWPAVKPLLASSRTPKPLLMAAIHAVHGICPKEEAEEILRKFTLSDDLEISDAAEEALVIGAPLDEDDDWDLDEDPEPPKWIN